MYLYFENFDSHFRFLLFLFLWIDCIYQHFRFEISYVIYIYLMPYLWCFPMTHILFPGTLKIVNISVSLEDWMNLSYPVVIQSMESLWERKAFIVTSHRSLSLKNNDQSSTFLLILISYHLFVYSYHTHSVLLFG